MSDISNDLNGIILKYAGPSDYPGAVAAAQFNVGYLQKIARVYLKTKQDITPFFKAHDRNPIFWGIRIHAILGGLNTKMANEAFFWAAKSGHVDFISQLLRLRRDVNPAVHKNKPIRLAALHGQLQVVRLLLRDNRIDPNACGSEAYNKARSKHPKIAALLKPYLPGHNRHRS